MSTFYVLHNVHGPVHRPTLEQADADVRLPWPANPYTLAAVLTARHLEQAFELTNTISREWWENEGILAARPARSTSMGDLIAEENGSLHLVMSMGWSELDQQIIFTQIPNTDPALLSNYRIKLSLPPVPSI